MTSLINVIRTDSTVSSYLAELGDLELERSDHGEEVHLASGAALEGFAGDAGGGTYFFCGEGGEERPVLYADSEGGAALLAGSLPELLTLLLVVPWWRDCREFSAEEDEGSIAELDEDWPGWQDRRDAAAAALGLALPPVAEVRNRLRDTATGPRAADHILVYTPENTPYERLLDS